MFRFLGIISSSECTLSAVIPIFLNENNPSMEKIEFVIQLSVEQWSKNNATPTLRLKVRNLVFFLNPGNVPEEQDIRHKLQDNKVPKQKRCNLCPCALYQKTYYKYSRCYSRCAGSTLRNFVASARNNL